MLVVEGGGGQTHLKCTILLLGYVILMAGLDVKASPVAPG